MPPENELKREMIGLLLSSSKFDFDKVKDLTKAAEILTDFILGKSQTQEPADT
ncbi:hypothetical protein [Psychrobacter sp. UBA3068]|uniref:hypothetical protein n=1 Tax=Psychrobacter sp. UBA3068 TaxID=1947349 RepID=UPI00257F5982|nr:hypothetical protein [Psychrobacter sp. UBA3068]